MTASQLVVITLKSDQRLVTARLTSGERIAWRLSCVLRVNSRFRFCLTWKVVSVPLSGRPVVEWSAWWHLRASIFLRLYRTKHQLLYICTPFSAHSTLYSLDDQYICALQPSNHIIEFLYPQVHVDFSKKAFAFDTQIQDMIVRKYIIRSCDRENKLNGGKIRLQLPQLVDS